MSRIEGFWGLFKRSRQITVKTTEADRIRAAGLNTMYLLGSAKTFLEANGIFNVYKSIYDEMYARALQGGLDLKLPQESLQRWHDLGINNYKQQIRSRR